MQLHMPCTFSGSACVALLLCICRWSRHVFMSFVQSAKCVYSVPLAKYLSNSFYMSDMTCLYASRRVVALQSLQVSRPVLLGFYETKQNHALAN